MDHKKKLPQHSKYIHTKECPITTAYGTNDVRENFYVTKEIIFSNQELRTYFKKIVEISNIAQNCIYELRRKMENKLYAKILRMDNKSVESLSTKFREFLDEYSLTTLLNDTMHEPHQKKFLCLNLVLSFFDDNNNPIAPIPTWVSNSDFIKKIQEPIYRETKNQVLFWALYSFLHTQQSNNKSFYSLLEINTKQYNKDVWTEEDDKGYEQCVVEGKKFVWDYINDYVYVTDNYKHWAIINTEKGSPAGLYQPHCYWYK